MDYNDLMEARIQFGDAVIIVTSAGGVVECYQDATVIHVPQDAGDLWQFQRPDSSVFALNPYHSSLIKIVKVPRSQP